MANDTAFRAGRFLQGQVTQDFAGCGPGNRPGFAGAAAGPGAAVTAVIECNPSAIDACPTMRGCQSQPPTALCTQTPELCPTFCGPACQTPQPNCTSINCTQAGPQCPPQTIAPPCPVETNVILDCTFGCTQFGPACPPTPLPQCGNVTLDSSCQTVTCSRRRSARPDKRPSHGRRCWSGSAAGRRRLRTASSVIPCSRQVVERSLRRGPQRPRCARSPVLSARR